MTQEVAVNNRTEKQIISDLPYQSLIDYVSVSLETLKQHPLFETDVDGNALWNLYLNYFSDEQRQSFDCNSCKFFFRRAAGLVIIDPVTFESKSAIWHTVPAEFQALADEIIALVEKAKVTEPFVHTRYSAPILGDDASGGFNHLHIRTIPASRGVRIVAQNVADLAKLKEGYDMLTRSLGDLSLPNVKAAAELFEHDKDLVNYPKQVSIIDRYLKLRNTLSNNHVLRQNQLWLFAVGNADAARIGNGVMGVFILMRAEKNAAAAKAVFLEMIDPENYQRPKALPSSGNTVVAEKLIAEHGWAKSLERRSAAPEDIIDWYWQPKAVSEVREAGSVFGNIQTKDKVTKSDATPIEGGTKSWVVFDRDVLPNVVKMKVKIPSSKWQFVGINTAVHFDAPPLFRNDSLEKRNPISEWTVTDGSYARDWGLVTNDADVLGIMNEHNEVRGKVLIIQGGKTPPVGSCLFPEIIDRRLFEVRATIEQYSRENRLEQIPNPAVGINIYPVSVVVVTSTGSAVRYTIDRFE